MWFLMPILIWSCQDLPWAKIYTPTLRFARMLLGNYNKFKTQSTILGVYLLIAKIGATLVKMTFSEIMWFEHFLFHQILTIFQHSHQFWAKSSLQVGMYLIIHTCKLIFTQWWWKCWNIVKIWWKTKCSNPMISKNVLFKTGRFWVIFMMRLRFRSVLYWLKFFNTLNLKIMSLLIIPLIHFIYKDGCSFTQ